MAGEETSSPSANAVMPSPPRTDPELFQHLRAATIFKLTDADSNQIWHEHLTRLLDELLDQNNLDVWHDVVLGQMCEVLKADVALVSEPVNAEVMRICHVWGAHAAGLLAKEFDRRRSIAGRVQASGLTAYVGSPRLRSPLSDVELYGPMVITPLPVGSLTLTVSVARLYTREALTAADMELAFGFATAAGAAVDAASALIGDPHIDRGHAVDSVLHALTAHTP